MYQSASVSNSWTIVDVKSSHQKISIEPHTKFSMLLTFRTQNIARKNSFGSEQLSFFGNYITKERVKSEVGNWKRSTSITGTDR